MKITIITVGKLKEKYLLEGIKEYSKRLSKYTKIEIIELKDEPAPESLSEKEMIQVIEAEGERIIQKINSESYVISLDIYGKQLSSEEFAEKIKSIQTYHSSEITFVIGGSLGLSDSIKKQSKDLLSFGTLTYPHQLMRLILIEQIYRAFRINNNEPYHK